MYFRHLYLASFHGVRRSRVSTFLNARFNEITVVNISGSGSGVIHGIIAYRTCCRAATRVSQYDIISRTVDRIHTGQYDITYECVLFSRPVILILWARLVFFFFSSFRIFCSVGILSGTRVVGLSTSLILLHGLPHRGRQ